MKVAEIVTQERLVVDALEDYLGIGWALNPARGLMASGSYRTFLVCRKLVSAAEGAGDVQTNPGLECHSAKYLLLSPSSKLAWGAEGKKVG